LNIQWEHNYKEKSNENKQICIHLRKRSHDISEINDDIDIYSTIAGLVNVRSERLLAINVEPVKKSYAHSFSAYIQYHHISCATSICIIFNSI
jgi:hypothetical protein